MQLLSFLCAVGLFCFASVGWAERSEAQQNPNKKIQIKKFGIGLFGFVGLRFAQSNLQDVSKFNSQFLWVVGVGPYIITVLMALAAGWQLHTLWGTPLLSCWGLLLIYLLQPNITRPQFYRFLVAVLVVFIIVISAYTFVMLKPNNKSSGNFPARNVAAQITQLWHAHYQQPLPYVIGDRVLASDVARYSVDKPRAHLGWDSGMNPWIDVATLKREGAIFVQRLDEGSDFPVSVREQFPGLKVVEIQDFGYVRATPDLSRIKIVVGILPPNS